MKQISEKEKEIFVESIEEDLGPSHAGKFLIMFLVVS